MPKKRKKPAPMRARGPYRRDLNGPTRYVRTSGDVDSEILNVYPNRTASDAYRAALAAWVKFRAYLRQNPPTNPELDADLADVVP